MTRKQELAEWMIGHGFATGHGDTFADLLEELSWQVGELRTALDSAKYALRNGSTLEERYSAYEMIAEIIGVTGGWRNVNPVPDSADYWRQVAQRLALKGAK